MCLRYMAFTDPRACRWSGWRCGTGGTSRKMITTLAGASTHVATVRRSRWTAQSSRGAMPVTMTVGYVRSLGTLADHCILLLAACCHGASCLCPRESSRFLYYFAPFPVHATLQKGGGLGVTDGARATITGGSQIKENRAQSVSYTPSNAPPFTSTSYLTCASLPRDPAWRCCVPLPGSARRDRAQQDHGQRFKYGMSSTTTHPSGGVVYQPFALHVQPALPLSRAVSLTTLARCALIDLRPNPSLTLTVWWCCGSPRKRSHHDRRLDHG